MTIFRFGPASGGEPSPIVSIDLTDEISHSTLSNLTALVDTGADGTLIPLNILQEAGFRPSRQRRRFYTAREDQSPEIVIGYSVLLRIGHFELHDVDIYASRSISEIILGRDVLNRLTFTYDGPQSILEILDAG
ncbi:MAG: retropepsin-like aspartic protease [Caldilineaceae bacterium]|nr:retroviral-like aspartic protease family protein [Caldilineaceae bacterium]